MQNSKSIGNKITEARKKVNLSQAELAQQVSISPQAVSKWERGESLPDITTLIRLAEIFGVNLNYFSSNSQLEDQVIESIVKPEEQSMLSKLRNDLGLNWNMSGESYVDADFSGIKNVNDTLSGSSFKKCKLIESDLSDITFKGNSITDCDFSKSDLRNSKFNGSEIKATKFINTTFIDASIESSEIRNCDFSNANLSGIEISKSEIRNTKIENTNWQHASLNDTQFTEMIFSGLLEDCTFTNCEFSKVTFNNVTIKNCFFKYSGLKRVEFIDCKADKLSYEFMKNCKADVSGISIMV